MKYVWIATEGLHQVVYDVKGRPDLHRDMSAPFESSMANHVSDFLTPASSGIVSGRHNLDTRVTTLTFKDAASAIRFVEHFAPAKFVLEGRS